MTQDQHPGSHRVDVAVVGGGLAGLTAAAFVGRSGARVTLLDGRAVGGRARSAGREGFTLNEGAHALYTHGAALAALRELGVAVSGAPPRPDTYRLVWDGEVVPMPTGAAALAGSRLLSAIEGEARGLDHERPPSCRALRGRVRRRVARRPTGRR